MKIPLMSVLMPVYNAERYLSESIKSVLNQTFVDFEFLIIDDGSTDNSAQLIQSYADPRIRFYKNGKNLGITPSLNRGIELAQADFIARMDADDICYPDRLQKQFDFIKAHPDGALFSCGAMEVSENRKPIKIEHHCPDHYYYNLTFSNWIYHPTMVYRKEAVMSIGNYTTPHSEDFELIWQISRKFKMYHQPEVLLEYRNSQNSLCQHSKTEEYRETFLKQVKRNIQYHLKDTVVELEDRHIDYMAFNVDFLNRENLVKNIVECTNLLDFITRKILEKENVNRSPEAIKAAAQIKREYSILFFTSSLGRFKKSIALIKTKSWKLLGRLIIGRFKRQKTSLTSYRTCF